jgi:rod shape-determining protein MreC
LARTLGNALSPTVSLKHVLHRIAYAGALASAVVLLMLGKVDAVLVEEARMAITDAMAPFVAATAKPLAEAAGFIEQVRELATLRDENGRLREENARLLEWQVLARRLDEENRSLRALTKFNPAPGATFVSARAIADTGGPFVRSLLIDTGARDGVERSQAVVTGDGLVGRIARVGNRSARVLLITDMTSRIPVSVGEGKKRAILAGDNSGQPRLIYLDQGVTVAPGDAVFTSGLGGMFPPGLPIGTVIGIADDVAVVTPFVDWHRLEFVRVVDYGSAGAGDRLLNE